MKKILPLLLIGILIISGFGAVAIPDSENTEQEITSITFSQPLLQEKDQYIQIDIYEANSFLMEVNKPLLPSYTHTFTFPFDTKINSVECAPSSIQQQHVSKKIMPSPEPVLASHKVVQAEKTVSYGNDPYPNTWFEYDVGCGINDNERCIFVKVQVFPVKYYPSEDMIEVASDFEINVKYEESDGQTPTFDDEYDFVILTPSEFSSTLNALVAHKLGRNISTKLVTLSEVYGGTHFPAEGRDDAEQIKYFIKNAIENWGTSYVLLVGGSEEFPTRMTHVYVNYNDGDDEEFVTDLYYADVFDEDGNFSSWDSNGNGLFGEFQWNGKTDDVDLYPDVYLGRLACTDSTQVTACVNKIITYETNKAYTQEWFTKLVVIGGDTSPHDDENVDEGEYVNQAVIDIMDGFIPDKIWDSNNRLSGRSPSGVENINNGINSGCGFVDWSGHGAPSVWTTYPHNGSRQSLPTPWGHFYNYQVSGLENGNKLPIVVTGACSVAKFISDPDCFTWSFVSNPNGGGICSIGPNSLSWGYDTSYVIEDLGGKMQVCLFKGYKEQGAYTFGEMWVEGLNGYISGGMDGGDHKTIEQWQPFGDPTLALREESLQPIKPEISGPGSGKIDTEYTYNATTTDPDGDQLYYLFSWGDDTYSEWIGPVESGNATEGKHVWTEQGDYEIKVKAKDKRGVQSEWSDPLPISMPKNNPLLYNFLAELIRESFPRFYIWLQQM